MAIESVSDFIKVALSLRNNGMSPTSFRGQKYSGWPMLPKLFRLDMKLYEHENFSVRDIVSIHPEEFSKDQTIFDRLVRMQHFDFPTRLLDVSINPRIALWFATEDFEKIGAYKMGWFMLISFQKVGRGTMTAIVLVVCQIWLI